MSEIKWIVTYITASLLVAAPSFMIGWVIGSDIAFNKGRETCVDCLIAEETISLYEKATALNENTIKNQHDIIKKYESLFLGELSATKEIRSVTKVYREDGIKNQMLEFGKKSKINSVTEAYWEDAREYQLNDFKEREEGDK